MQTIDLNCDLGESFGHFVVGNDVAMLDYVTSVNIACGFHAGDPVVMQHTVEMALQKNVAIGAHPGFPDLLGFGRRKMDISAQEARAYVMYQIGALVGIVEASGGKLQHVKPHGALYNMAAADEGLARAIAEAVYAIDPELILMGLAGGELVKCGKELGLKTASEIFSDRAYTKEGKLVSRAEKNGVIQDKEKAAAQILHILRDGYVTAADGTEVRMSADTICIHGDTEKNLELIRYVKNILLENDVQIDCLDTFIK